MANEEAEKWYLRLNSGEATKKDYEEFTSWLKSSDVNRDAYFELSEVDQILDDIELYPPGILHVLQKHQPKPLWKVLAPIIAVAALLLLVFTLMSQLKSNQIEERKSSAHVLKSGLKVKSFTLEDGSVLELDAHTELRVSFSEKERATELIKGQALFKVSKDTERPFTVKSDQHKVTVIGTVFTVKEHEDSSLDVKVSEGLVKVAVKTLKGGTGEVFLEAEDWLQWSPENNQIVQSEFKVDEEFALWRQERVKFHEITLREFFEEFRRYHEFDLNFQNDSLKKLSVSGSFSTSSLVEACAAIEVLHDLKCRYSDGVLSIEK
ncbi:MAG: FecR domain-containing protein [Lentisphaerales bacterium]|nr:FecR domain-containing protein [Lentisphaerales bacterium]